ncbi:hypothetical protein L198_03894 [Cryptococcus wingfieldii CBS 7118]|uniref:Uncharacterized protein n=1 Tax=Cryptococcus wingfieldii CBS 7118 TaxID=1295528 RepID=A0A1E3JBP1_9TREE|nr:hypothetical protein L198_03894 [Cryptococcus wingfieldii CBS 7118]ODN97331.1 hypothetical protein L198_03894 [Cryptococcus wingfieldii CBS 7118]
MRPSVMLRGVAEDASSHLAKISQNAPSHRPKLVSRFRAQQLSPNKQPKFLILNNVPKLALPQDVLRALQDAKAVGKSFPLSSITALPPSLPRMPSLTRKWHIEIEGPRQTLAIHAHVNAHPLFATSSSTLPYPTGKSPNRNLNLNPKLHMLEAAQLSWSTKEEWTEATIEMATRNELKGTRGVDWRSTESWKLTVDWALQPEFRGRRVVVRGLPGGVTVPDLARLASGCSLREAKDAIMTLPPSIYSLNTTCCFTLASVADAHRLVRKVHMKWYKSLIFGEEYLMRAEVVN